MKNLEKVRSLLLGLALLSLNAQAKSYDKLKNLSGSCKVVHIERAGYYEPDLQQTFDFHYQENPDQFSTRGKVALKASKFLMMAEGPIKMSQWLGSTIYPLIGARVKLNKKILKINFNKRDIPGYMHLVYQLEFDLQSGLGSMTRHYWWWVTYKWFHKEVGFPLTVQFEDCVLKF